MYCIMFEARKIVEFMAKDSGAKGDTINMEDVCSFVLKVGSDQPLVTELCGIYHNFKAGEVLFVPQGWVCCEAVAANVPVVYGVRKSFMAKSAASLEAYKFATELMRKSGRDVSRMQAIAKLLA